MPLYDVRSHKHKYTDTTTSSKINCPYAQEFHRVTQKGQLGSTYDPPLPTSILPFKSEKGKHKTQKPTTMMKWILKYYSKEDDVILDPTMGSGSMGVACKEMNRRFIGIEMDKDIFEVACDRLNESY